MTRTEFLAEFILQSDSIERIKDSRALLEGQIAENKSDGHVGALLYLEGLLSHSDKLLTEADIRKVQALITEEQALKDPTLKIDAKYIGEYRDTKRSVFRRVAPTPEQIPREMFKLVLHAQLIQKEGRRMPELFAVSEIADWYFDFEMLHPFYDGNGRTGRAIVYYLFRCLGREPFIFTAEEMYMGHFTSLDAHEPRLMRKYFWEKSGLL